MTKTKLYFLIYFLFTLLIIGGLSVFLIFYQVESDFQKAIANRALEELKEEKIKFKGFRDEILKTKDSEMKLLEENLKLKDEITRWKELNLLQKKLFEECNKEYQKLKTIKR